MVEEAEDDIPYAEGGYLSADNTTTLLFIHQSAEQLQILKRSGHEVNSLQLGTNDQECNCFVNA